MKKYTIELTEAQCQELISAVDYAAEQRYYEAGETADQEDAAAIRDGAKTWEGLSEHIQNAQKISSPDSQENANAMPAREKLIELVKNAMAAFASMDNPQCGLDAFIADFLIANGWEG